MQNNSIQNRDRQDLDQSYDFKEETQEHQQLFNKRKKFSYIVLFIYIGYIVSFILENRSADLEDLNHTLEPLVKDRLNIYTSYYENKFDSLISIGDAYSYAIDRLHFIFLNLEPKADRFFQKSVLNSQSDNDYKFTHLNFIQSFNILEGAVLTLVTEDKREIKKYFSATLNQDQFYSRILGLTKDLVLGPNPVNIQRLSTLRLEFIFYNVNNEVSIYFDFTCGLNKNQGFYKQFDKTMFIPRFNDRKSKYFTEQVIVWIIRLIYLSYFIFFVFEFLIGDIMVQIKELYYGQKIYVDSYTIIYLLYIVVNTNYFVIYYKLLRTNAEYDGKPLENEDQFRVWVDMSQSQKQVYKYNGFLTIFLIIRLMDMIQLKFFESLRIVFYSFAVTGDLLVTFFMAIGLFLIAFLAYSNLVLVEFERAFINFLKTFEIIALSIFQNYSFPQSSLTEHLDQNLISPIFFVLLFIFFNTFAIQFFIAIIVSSYRVIRRKYQNSLEAYEEMEKRQGSKIFKKLIAFATLTSYSKYNNYADRRKNIEMIDDEKSNISASSNKKIKQQYKSQTSVSKKLKQSQKQGVKPNIDQLYSFNENSALIRQKKQDLTKKKIEIIMESQQPVKTDENKPIWQILSHNYQSLQLFDEKGDEDFLSRDNRINILNQIKEEIKGKKKLAMQKKVIYKDRVSIFAKFLLYLIYISLFVLVIRRHLIIIQKYEVYSSITKDIESRKFSTPTSLEKINFYQIATLSDYSAWVKDFTNTFTSNQEKGSFPAIAKHNYQLTSLSQVYYFSKKSLVDNIIVINKKHKPQKINDPTNPKNSTVVHYLNERKSSLFDYDESAQVQERGLYDDGSRIQLNYSINHSGILLMVQKNQIPDPKSKHRYFNTTEFNQLYDRVKIGDVDVVKCGLETMLINLNKQLISYLTFTISINKSGGILPQLEIGTIAMKQYNTSYFYIIAELILVIVILRQFYTVYVMFNEIYQQPKLKALTECDEIYKDCDFFTRIMNHPVEKVESLREAAYRFLNYFWRHGERMLETFSIFLSYKTLFVPHVISVFLSSIAIYYWIRIIYLSNQKIFNLEYILKGKTGDEERDVYELVQSLCSHFTYYRKIQGLNAIFLVCGIFAYFTFSLKLSVVLHVVRLAQRDLLSYAIIFVTIVFGFGTGGYMIYGDKLDNFNSVLRSSLEIILMTIGGVNYELMKSAESFVTPIFVFTYLIAAYIIFLKMFIVILDATYNDLINFVKNEDMSLMNYINALIEEITKQVNNYLKGMSDSEIRNKYKDKDGLINQILLVVELFYYKVVISIEKQLWMITKAILQFKKQKGNFDRVEDKSTAVNAENVYKRLRSDKHCKNMAKEIDGRFKSNKSVKTFLTNYLSEEKSKKKLLNAEDSNGMNEWFNTVNNYIEASTNKNYSLNASKSITSSVEKKEVLFSFLEIYSLINFRNINFIDKNMSLTQLSDILQSKVNRKQLLKKLEEKVKSGEKAKNEKFDIENGGNAINQSNLIDEKLLESSDLQPKFIYVGNILKLMLFELYLKISVNSKNPFQNYNQSNFDSKISSNLQASRRTQNNMENSLMEDNQIKRDPESMDTEISLYEVTTEINENRSSLQYLNMLWQSIPSSFRYDFWIQDDKNYMSIHQKYFYFSSVEFSVSYKSKLFVFKEFITLLHFLVVSKLKKGKFKENQVKQNFIEENLGNAFSKNLYQSSR